MKRGIAGSKLACLFAGLIIVAVASCSEIRPEPDVEEGGLLESPTHEQDALRRAEEHEEHEAPR